MNDMIEALRKRLVTGKFKNDVTVQGPYEAAEGCSDLLPCLMVPHMVLPEINMGSSAN